MKRKTIKHGKKFALAIIVVFLLFLNKSEVTAQEVITTKIFMLPDLETFEQADSLTVNIFGQAEIKSINLANVVLEFDSSKLSLSEISYSDSFCKLLIFENIEESKSDIACGTFTANLDEIFLIAKISFEKKTPVSDWVDFYLGDSLFFAHDGYGTNIIPESETHKILLHE